MKKKNKFIILSFIIIPVFFIAFFEIAFLSTYKVTKSKFFENYSEAKARNSSSYDNLFYNKKELELTKKKKVAVFGGSISKGYAIPTNFSQLLKKLNLEDLIVHNYSENGSTFSYYQSELIEILYPLYDYIIIYSGDNELWSYLCLKSIKNKKEIVLPNNFSINPTCRDRHYSQKKLIKKIFNNERSTILQIESFIKNQSRFILFIDRFIFHAKNYLKKNFNNVNSLNKTTTINYYLNKGILEPNERYEMFNNFKQSMNKLLKNITYNQTLILISPVSNDLSPPSFEILKSINSSQDDKSIIKITRKNYQKILNKDYINLNLDINNNQINHHLYFKGMKCIGEKNQLSQKCLKFLQNSRNQDQFPMRIISEVKNFIDNINQKNVEVIKIDNIINKSKNIYEYSSFFVDVHHLSVKSHLVILENILKVIFPEEKSFKIKKKNEICDEYILTWKNNNFDIKFNKNKYKKVLQTNQGWLEGIKSLSDHRYNLDYFLNLNSIKQKKCL